MSHNLIYPDQSHWNRSSSSGDDGAIFKAGKDKHCQESDDIAISPIGIPLIAGPGAITAAMLLSSQTQQFYSYVTLGLSIFLVLSLVYLILRNGDVLMNVLGTTGMRIIQRLMGLILLVIAVQFVINGAVSVIRPLISPSF